jgi:4-carboxymuconolactone decarboxylase
MMIRVRSLAVLVVIGVFAAALFSVRSSAKFRASAAPQQGSSDARAAAAPARPAALPKDVYPDSLNRLPLVQRKDLDEPAQKIYDYFASPTGGSLAGLQGPGGLRLHSPRIAVLEEPLNHYTRYETGIPRRLTELAILVTAREFDSQFEWAAHEPAALKAGLEPSIIDVIKYRKGVQGLGEKEAAIISMGRELFGQRNLSSATFARALNLFGKKEMVELVYLMTSYVSTSFFLRAFDMQLHADQKPPLPVP